MTYRPDREKHGFCKVTMRGGDWWILQRNEFEPIIEAIKRGDEWYEAVNLFGGIEYLRLSTVMHIGEASPVGIAAYDAEEDERLAYKKAHGEDD